nr:hypothetical protein [Tanacetum cinerariifolium]
MNLDNYDEPAVLVTCRSREEFCLVTGLRFWVDYSDEYKKEGLIPFRRRVSDQLKMLVLLGLEDRRKVPDCILRMAIVREDWDMGYFDGNIHEPTRILRPVNQHNQNDVPADFYREFKEQKKGVEGIDAKGCCSRTNGQKMYKFMVELQLGEMPQPKKGSIIVGNHYGLSDFSGFENTQNLMNRGRREACPSIYLHSSFTRLHATTFLPKKQGDKSKNKRTNANVSPFNLGKAIVDANVDAKVIMITGFCWTDD